MEIALISSDKLKISLGREDMTALGLDYEELDSQAAGTHQVLVELLEQAKAETGFSPRGAKLLVEVYPSEAGGCVLHFTCLGSRFHSYPAQLALEPVVFRFDDADTLVHASIKVFERYSHRIYKSSLYRYRGGYHLVVYPLDYSDQLSVYFLSEYGQRVGDGEVLAAYMEEHGECILEENAIDTLSEHFS